jgi:hypothetical protein
MLLPVVAKTLDPESVDLAKVVELLHRSLGASVAGAVVGRTLMRDVVVRHFDCSELEAERLVDTLVARKFVQRREDEGGRVEWLIP